MVMLLNQLHNRLDQQTRSIRSATSGLYVPIYVSSDASAFVFAAPVGTRTNWTSIAYSKSEESTTRSSFLVTIRDEKSLYLLLKTLLVPDPLLTYWIWSLLHMGYYIFFLLILFRKGDNQCYRRDNQCSPIQKNQNESAKSGPNMKCQWRR